MFVQTMAQTFTSIGLNQEKMRGERKCLSVFGNEVSREGIWIYKTKTQRRQ